MFANVQVCSQVHNPVLGLHHLPREQTLTHLQSVSSSPVTTNLHETLQTEFPQALRVDGLTKPLIPG